MLPANSIGTNLTRLIVQAAKFPILYLIFGIILLTLSSVNELFPVTYWKKIFIAADDIGHIFISLAILTFGYNFLEKLCRYYESNLVHNHAIGSVLLPIIRKSLFILFVLIGVKIIFLLIGAISVYQNIVRSSIDTVIIAAIGWIAIQVLQALETILYKKMVTLSHEEHIRIKALYTKMHILRNITTVAIVIITVAAILMNFNSVRTIGISLLASAGFITAILGLAAQKTLFSIFSGLQIALSQQIKIGDKVVIETETGIIEEINLTFVTIKLADTRRLVVPINYFIEKPFENWSHDAHSMQSSFHLYVDYLMPLAPLKSELKKILQKSAYWDKKTSNLQVSNMTEHSVELNVQVSAINPTNLANLCIEVREKLLEYMQNNYPNSFPTIRLDRSS
jgi:small-conductance mechanosensitive channel